VSFTAEVLLHLGERQDVIDCVELRGGRAQGDNISAERAALLLSMPCSRVVQLPPQLPCMLHLSTEWSTASYGISTQEWATMSIASELEVRRVARQQHADVARCSGLLLSQAYGAWAGSAIQLDRAGQGQHAPTTVYKTASTVRRMLGFSQNVLQQSSPLTLAAMLNGDMVAAYASFSLDVRCALSTTTRSPTHPDTCSLAGITSPAQ
jgi:hypothetical protein